MTTDKMTREFERVNKNPTHAQIENCARLGWMYCGNGEFAKEVGNKTFTGYFVGRNFVKD